MKKQDVASVERTAKALELRASGMSYDEIAKQLKFANRGGAFKCIQRALSRYIHSKVEHLRAEELLILDELHAKVWPDAIGDNESKKPSLKAIDTILAIMHVRCRLLGLYPAPTKPGYGSSRVVIREAAKVEVKICHQL